MSELMSVLTRICLSLQERSCLESCRRYCTAWTPWQQLMWYLNVPGTRREDKLLCMNAHNACFGDSVQPVAHGTDWGIKMCCSTDSLAEQCTRCDIENWVLFVLDSGSTNSNQLNSIQYVAGTKTPQQNVLLQNLACHKKSCPNNVSKTCPPVFSRPYS